MHEGAPMKLTVSIILATSLLISNCAHYADVLAGSDGIHKVIATPEEDDEDPDEEELTRDAINQATDYCKELFQAEPEILSAKKSPVPDPDRTVYQVVVRFKCRQAKPDSAPAGKL